MGDFADVVLMPGDSAAREASTLPVLLEDVRVK